MKVQITNAQGVVIEGNGDGFEVEGVEGKKYPFKGLWDDLQGTVHGNTGTGNADLTYEGYRDTDFNMYFFRHNQDDQINVIYQMTHTWDPTTQIWPHMHIIPMSNASGVIYFQYSYAWVPRGSILSANSGWTTGNVSVSVIPTDQYKHITVGFGNITPPVNAGPSTMFLFKMKRLGTSPSDTYDTNKTDGTGSANVGVLYTDLHFQKNKAGTDTQYY